MKAAKLRKTDYLTKKEEEEVIEEYSVKRLIKIFIILLVIFGIFYGITYLVVKNKKAEITEEEPYAVIDEEKITISNLLNQKREEYYVLITKESLYNKKGSLASDYKKLYEENKEIFSMCFTRVSYAKTGYSEGFTKPNRPGCTRIVFNKDKLTTIPNSKFTQVNFWYNEKLAKYTPKHYATQNGDNTKVENEERLLSTNPDVKNANEYIDRIDIYINEKALTQFDLHEYFQKYASSIFYPKIYVYFDLDNFNYANTDYAMTLIQAIKNLKNHSLFPLYLVQK